MKIYGDSAPSETTCRDWFRRFRSGNFDVEDMERPDQLKKFKEDELQAHHIHTHTHTLLNQNQSQTLKELAEILNVAILTVSKCLHILRKIQKEEKWVLHKLTAANMLNRVSVATSLLGKKKKSFLCRIVTGDKKWIHYDNPKRKKSWVDPGQPPTSASKLNIHDHKALLCISWDQEGAVHNELLKPSQTVMADRYRQ